MVDDRPQPKNQTEQEGAAGEAELSRRLDRLGQALNERRQETEESGGSRVNEAQGFAHALRLSTEFVAGVLVGAALGWAFDKGLGTSPWGLIVFLLLGFCAGVFNVLRSAGLMAEPGKGTAVDKSNGGRSEDRSKDKTIKG